MVGKPREDTTGTGDEAAAQASTDGAGRIGRVVGGRWRLERVLGRGGTAIVYEAVHRNGHRAALKILHPELALQGPIVRRFLREGYAANRVQHPGAVRVLDDGEDAGLVYIVLELLRGRSLGERLTTEGRPLPVEDVVRTAIETLDVLAAAHDVGVVHRDVKPSNLFELDGGGLKVLDFGVARIQGAAEPSITRSGVALGTPAFMAPEQAAGRADEVDALTDVWSLGATMFWLLSGRPVHDAVCGNAAIVAAATREAAPIRDLVPQIPVRIAAVVDRALAFERGKRWPNARAMRRALCEPGPASHASASHDGLEVGETLVTAPAPPRPARRLAQGAALFCAIALVGGTLVHISSRGCSTTNAPAGIKPGNVRSPPRDPRREPEQAVTASTLVEPRPSYSATHQSTPTRTAAPARSARPSRQRATVSGHDGEHRSADDGILDRRK